MNWSSFSALKINQNVFSEWCLIVNIHLWIHCVLTYQLSIFEEYQRTHIKSFSCQQMRQNVVSLKEITYIFCRCSIASSYILSSKCLCFWCLIYVLWIFLVHMLGSKVNSDHIFLDLNKLPENIMFCWCET